MDNQRCETCRFWEYVGYEEEFDESFGRCRRLPPVFNRDAADHWYKNSIGQYVNEIGVWPHTVITDWCGEYQPLPPTPENPVVVTSTLDMNQP